MDKKIVERIKRIYERFNILLPFEVDENLKEEELFFLMGYICEKRGKEKIFYKVEKPDDLDFFELYLL